MLLFNAVSMVPAVRGSRGKIRKSRNFIFQSQGKIRGSETGWPQGLESL